MAKETPVKGKKAVVVPDKQTMNFVHHQSSVNLKKLIPVVAIIIIAAALFAKFGILDQIDKKTEAYNKLSLKQAQQAAVEAKLSGYDELANQYGRYSYGWMNQSEISTVDRMDVIKVIEDKIAPVAVVENFAVNSNVLTLNLHGITLNQASSIVRELEASELVESATVYTAAAPDGSEAKIFMSVILTKEGE